MESRLAIWALGLLFFTLVGSQNGMIAGSNGNSNSSGGSRNCKFPAIFNFGDSHSDTGASSVAFMKLDKPNGMSFPQLFGRSCDGRLIIDFIAENLGLPYLDPLMNAVGTNFKHGANFATGGAMINSVVVYGVISPFHLDVQVSQFLQFKSHAIAQHKQFQNTSNNPPIQNNLPEPEVFSRALYTIDIGGNDCVNNYSNLPPSNVMDQYSNALQRLLRDGAKYLWIHNTGPNGCGAGGATSCRSKAGCVIDKNGCDEKMNEASQEFNKMLKDRVVKLRAQYPEAVITYVDIYSAKQRLIANATNYGFGDPFKVCCGTEKYSCAKKDFNKTILGTACNEPQKYINWDGTHYTEAANRFVANFVVNGSLSDPPAPIAEACHKQ